MITNTQFALLIGVPTGTVIFFTIAWTLHCRKWARIFREGTERSEAQHRAFIERHKIWEGTRNNVYR